MSSAPALKIELFLNGSWTDVTADVYQDQPCVITRGRRGEDGQAGPQQLQCVFKNLDGKYSPRNPLSPLFGQLGRNTKIRASVSAGASRFYGEVASWEPKWNEGHTFKWVPIVANGIFRRMGQGSTPASVALKDWILSQTQKPATYYPLAGGDTTTYSLNLGEVSTNSTRFRGVANPGPGPLFTYGVEMPSWIGTGMELNDTGTPTNSFMEGGCGAVATNIAFDFVFQSPNLGVLDIRLFDTRDSYFNLRLNTSADAGTMQASYYDDINGLITDTASGAIPALQDTNMHHCRFLLKTISGPLVQYVGYIDGDIKVSGNIIAKTLEGLYLFRLFYERYSPQTVMNMAHLTVWAENTATDIPLVTDFMNAAFAYTGETAADRISRIAVLAGTTATIDGTASATTKMGPQVSETRLQQLRDAETTDMGILAESRDAFALLYRTRRSMYTPAITATLDYAGKQVFPPFEPVDDDQQTRNDVTASRRDGGDYRIVKTSGALSILDPPNGVGPYEDSITVNVETDAQLRGHAAWWLNLGTLDEARFPTVSVDLSSADIDNTKATTVRALDIGDHLTIVNLGDADITDDLRMIVLGYSETITQFQHIITFVCMPATPYIVGTFTDTKSRFSPDGSTLTSNITTTATSISLTKSGTSLWTTASGAFPMFINVGGEKMLLTAVSGASSPQTGTVARSINGVIAAHSAGTPVKLWDAGVDLTERAARYGL